MDGGRRNNGRHGSGNRFSAEDSEEPAGGGRWDNDMYDSTQQSPPRSRNSRRGGGGQWNNNRGGGRSGRGRNYGYGGDRSGNRPGDGFSGDGRRDHYGGDDRGGGWNGRGGYGKGPYNNNDTDRDWGRGGGGMGDRDDAGAQQGELPMANERWQKHAQAVGAGWGDGGGSFHQRRGHVQDQRPGPDAPREQGRVCSIKDNNFGFVRCVDRPGDLFFHLTEAPQDVNVGDEVDFVVGTGGRSGKDCALSLNVLPPGSIVTETILEGVLVGVIDRDIRSFHPSMPSSQRAQMMGRSRAHDHNQAEGLIKIIGAAPPEYQLKLKPVEDEQDASHQETGDGNETFPETVDGQEHENEHGQGEEQAVEGVPDQAVEDYKEQGVTTTAVPDVALGLTGAMVSYGHTDTLDEEAGSRLRRGDEVLLRVSQEKVTGRKKAIEVSLLRTNKERRQEEQLQKLIDSGASKQQGVVKRLSHDYGFLQSLSCSESVYFSTSDVIQEEEGNAERLRIGSHAEFWAVPDRDKDGKQSYRALDVQLLAPGTLVLEEQVHEGLTGIVERAPVVPQRLSFGRDGGGGGIQPGAGRFSLPAVEGNGSREGAEVVPSKKGGVVASLHPKELGKTNVPTLEAGDVIEADIWKSRLGGKQCQAKNVRLIRFGGVREEGVVRSLREGGFGFIRPLQGGDDVYFRVGDVCRNLPDIMEGSEALYTAKDSDRGDKQRGARVEILPKGTLRLEWPLASGVSGVVTQDAKGRGAQGMITITDGNALELPPSLKFPKIAARIRDFVVQETETELVFPSTITPGEKKACRRIAAEEGLGHELRGEESRRTLHIWKPDDEEAATLKAAEEARKEESCKVAKERSKNGERSLSLPFTRRDIVSSTATGAGTKKDATNSSGDCVDADEKQADKPDRPQQQSTQDFRKEGRASSPGEAKRGDLVTFDVILNRGTMKRRATNVKVMRRASSVPSDSTGLKLNGQETEVGRVGEVRGSGDGDGDQKEYLGVVSLVNTDRHFGFIDALGQDERVFFHLSEVLPDGVTAASASDQKQKKGAMKKQDGPSKVSNDSQGGTGSKSNISSSPHDPTAPKAPADAGGGAVTAAHGGAIIKRGQEVSFQLGQRQGKPLGLRVRKVKAGTLPPPPEETLPSKFVGVIVVAPRSMGSVGNADKDAVECTPSSELEGMLVMLHEKRKNQGTAGMAGIAAGDVDGATAAQDVGPTGGEGEGEPAAEAAKEATKVQRMLSSAGLGLRSPTVAVPSPTKSDIVEAADESQRTGSIASAGAVGKAPVVEKNGFKTVHHRGPPRYALMRFVTQDSRDEELRVVGDEMEIGEGRSGQSCSASHELAVASASTCTSAEDVPACTATTGDAVDCGLVSLERGDVVEFTVIARRVLGGGGGMQRGGNGQGPQLRVGSVSLLEKAGIKCRRGKLAEIDARGTARIECPTDDENGATSKGDVDDDGEGRGRVAAANESYGEHDAKNTPRVFFLVKEMVGAAGPLRKGDEVEYLVPEGKAVEAGRRAVGAIRVQDLKSLSATRQRLNLDLRDSQKGPQVRMAQGPDGEGFKPGHRVTPSLYADSIPAKAPIVAEPMQSEERSDETEMETKALGKSETRVDGDGEDVAAVVGGLEESSGVANVKSA